jgi:hypothetical protein
MTDFSKTLIRASCFGKLMTEPKEKAAKDAGELSKTAKTHLIETYVLEKYGRQKDIQTKQMLKGIDGEEEGIKLLSEYKEQALLKNLHRLSDEYFTGIPDIFASNEENKLHIIDLKLSWDLFTFLPNISEPLNRDYVLQLQAYFALTGATTGEIAFVLVNTPSHIIESEKYYLLRRMNVATEEAPEYKRAAERLELNMIYPDISISDRVLIFEVQRDDELIEQMRKKVVKAREFLQEFEEKHLNFNKNRLILLAESI